MKLYQLFSSIIILLISSTVFAEAADEVLAHRGKGRVTQKEFTARVDKIPADTRLAVLRDGKRLSDVVVSMLLRSQLAADAREAGFDQQEIVKERMRLAADSELGDAWMQHYIDTQPPADYEALARESYQLHQSQYLTEEKIDVSHILISNEDRSEGEARGLADTVERQLKADPASFDGLVLEYSEDPAAAANKGRYYAVKKGQMVPQFEKAAFSLSVGEISAPVETQYGFHIIRLDARIAPTQSTYDDVRDRLLAAEKNQHDDRIRQAYIRELASLDAVVTKEALEELVRRLFDETSSE